MQLTLLLTLSTSYYYTFHGCTNSFLTFPSGRPSPICSETETSVSRSSTISLARMTTTCLLAEATATSRSTSCPRTRIPSPFAVGRASSTRRLLRIFAPNQWRRETRGDLNTNLDSVFETPYYSRHSLRVRTKIPKVKMLFKKSNARNRSFCILARRFSLS